MKIGTSETICCGATCSNNLEAILMSMNKGHIEQTGTLTQLGTTEL